MATVLAIAQGMCDLIGVPRPTALIGSTDQQGRQILELLREELDELHDLEWQRPMREQTFTTVAAEEQTAALPTTFRSFVNGTFFNRTTRERLIGPLSAQQWQSIKAWPEVASYYIAWRERDNKFLTTPEPAAGQTIAYEYLTDAKVKNGAVEKTEITLDTDEPLLNNQLVKLGLCWRFLQAKGLDYSEAMSTYERRKATLMAKDGGAPVLTIGGWGRCSDRPFVTGLGVTLSGGLLLEDGGNLLLEDAPA